MSERVFVSVSESMVIKTMFINYAGYVHVGALACQAQQSLHCLLRKIKIMYTIS